MRQITIGEWRSYDDWGLLLHPNWRLEGARPKTQFIDIPASDGSIDISEVLAGEPRFNDRNFTCTLILPPYEKVRKEWEDKRREITNYCNGKRLKITTPDDDMRYLIGRISVAELQRRKGHALLNISAVCEPWLYHNNLTSINISTDRSINRVLQNARRRVIPTITTDEFIGISINGVHRSVSAGVWTIPDFVLNEGDNLLQIGVVGGHPNVNISYQQADL